MQGYCVINVILSISVTTVNLISIKLIICKQRYFLANIYQLERFICRKFAQSSFNNLNNRLLTPHNGLDQKMLEDGERLRSSRDRDKFAQHDILQRVGIKIFTAILNTQYFVTFSTDFPESQPRMIMEFFLSFPSFVRTAE